MHNRARQPDLAALRAQIADIEKRPLLADDAIDLPAGAADDGGLGLLAAPPGLLQEIHTDAQRDGTAALGFALGMARALLTPERPAMLFMQLAHDAQDTGLPYGPGLVSFGIDPSTLILGRLKTLPELLWAIEEAVACRAVAAVIAEIAGQPKTLDFTASRRLGMRAASGGASIFLLRHGLTRDPTAARLRWHLAPAVSGVATFDPRAPDHPRWQASIEKGRLGKAVRTGTSMTLDWTEHGFELADIHRKATRWDFSGAPASRPQPAALGYRLSQAS